MIYDYRCNKCKYTFQREVTMTKFSDLSKPKRCPKCKSTRTVKLILSAPKVHFKGTGFYVTDKGK